MEQSLSLHPYSPEYDDGLYELVTNHLVTGRTLDEWRWAFKAAPGVRCLIAKDGGKIVGQYVTTDLPLISRLRPHVESCLLSVDTTVHGEYRRRGLFTAMVDTFYGESVKDKPFVVGVVGRHRKSPEAFAAAGFQTICDLQWYEFTPKILTNLYGHRKQPYIDIDFTNREYSAWRYRHPARHHTVYTMYGQITAFNLNDSTVVMVYTGLTRMDDIANVVTRMSLVWNRQAVRWLGAAHDPLAIALVKAGASVVDSGYSFIGRLIALDGDQWLKAENWYPQAGHFDVF